MKVFWGLVAMLCGVLGGITVWTVGRQAFLHTPTGRSLFVLAFGLAILYIAWRCALRTGRPPVRMPAPLASAPVKVGLPPHRVIASLVFAIIVMVATFAVCLGLADSGDWGGEHGMLYSSLWLLGHGTWLAVAEVLHIRSLGLVAEAVQFGLLVAMYYSLATLWERRHRAGLGAGARVGVARSILPTQRAVAMAALVLGSPILLAALTTVANWKPVRTVVAYQDSDGKWHSDTKDVVPPVLTAGRPVFASVSFQGEVVMKVLVTREGKVDDLRLDDRWVMDHGTPSKLKGIDVEEAKDAAVREWTYRPATVEGRAVPVFVRVGVRFRPT
jgi:hypothetical protein